MEARIDHHLQHRWVVDLSYCAINGLSEIDLSGELRAVASLYLIPDGMTGYVLKLNRIVMLQVD